MNRTELSCNACGTTIEIDGHLDGGVFHVGCDSRQEGEEPPHFVDERP